MNNIVLCGFMGCGKTTVGIESTIVSVEGNCCRLLRPGYITLDDIEKALPGLFVFDHSKPEKLLSPGLLKSHYSPRKPLFLLKENDSRLPELSGLILHRQPDKDWGTAKVAVTSQTGNTIEIAANLFAALHQMEEDTDVKTIFIEPVAAQGLGVAIMDRMMKAAYQYNHHDHVDAHEGVAG